MATTAWYTNLAHKEAQKELFKTYDNLKDKIYMCQSPVYSKQVSERILGSKRYSKLQKKTEKVL